MKKNLFFRILISSLFALVLFSSCEDKYMDTKDAGEEYLKKNAESDTVQLLANGNGIQYKVYYNNPYGENVNTALVSLVKIHYTAYFIDGTKYEEYNGYKGYSYLPYGLQEVLRKMKTGSKWRVWIPHNLLYGSDGTESSSGGYSIDPYPTLYYDVEFLEIINS